MKCGRICFVFCALAAFVIWTAGCAVRKPAGTTGAELPAPEGPAVYQEKPGVGVVPPEDTGAEEPEREQQPAGPARLALDYAAVRERVAGRLSRNDEKLARWQALDDRMRELDLGDDRPSRWDECLMALEDTVISYSREAELLREPAPTGIVSGPSSLDSLWQEINFFESGCGLVYEKAEEAVKKRQGSVPVQETALLEGAVVNYALQGRDDEAIQAFRNLTAASPEFLPSAETRYRYALALVRTGESTEAISFLRQNLDKAPNEGTSWSLQQLFADLLLINGELTEAQEQYGRLAEYFETVTRGKKWVDEQLAILGGDPGRQSEELALFRDFLAKYLAFDGRKVPPALKSAVLEMEERYPESPVAGRARQILWLAEERAGSWLGRQLVLVDRLMEEKDFSRAAEILEKLLAEDLSDDVRKIVQEAKDRLMLVEGVEEKAQEAVLEETRTRQWEKAHELLGLQQYDEAIAAFQELRNTEFDEKAKTGIGEAVNAAAAELRRKAAALFVKARKTEDREKKRQLMAASLNLLQQILTKYAEADIIEKVRLNIGVLEEQLRLVDQDSAMPPVVPAGQE